jgi:hypothetical protein
VLKEFINWGSLSWETIDAAVLAFAVCCLLGSFMGLMVGSSKRTADDEPANGHYHSPPTRPSFKPVLRHLRPLIRPTLRIKLWLLAGFVGGLVLAGTILHYEWAMSSLLK